MPAPKQPKTPVYKETSNITRFNTNYYKFDDRKSAGVALSKAVGAFSKLGAQQAKFAQKNDFEEGKQLALMGIERENLREAAGGSGVFSGMGGWTQMGFDMQRGIEDAFIKQSELIEAYNASGLSETDDPRAFQEFVNQQQQGILANLEGVPEFYRTGYLEGISPAFQKMGRAFNGTADSFRQRKKTAAFKERARASIASGNSEELRELVKTSPNDSGVDTSTASQAAQEALLEEVEKGTITAEDAEAANLLNKDNKRRLQENQDRKQTEADNQAVIEQQKTEERQNNLVWLAIQKDDQEALGSLRDEFPSLYQDVLARKAQPDRVIPTEAMDEVKQILLNDVDYGSQKHAKALTDLYLDGDIDTNSFKELSEMNENQMKHGAYLNNYKIQSVLNRVGLNELPDNEEALARSLLLDEVVEYYDTTNKYPKGPELAKMAATVMTVFDPIIVNEPQQITPPLSKPNNTTTETPSVTPEQQNLMDKYK